MVAVNTRSGSETGLPLLLHLEPSRRARMRFAGRRDPGWGWRGPGRLQEQSALAEPPKCTSAMRDDGHIKGIYFSSLEPDASSFLSRAESRLSMEFFLPFPKGVSQSQALGSSSVAKRKQISKHTPPSIPPFLGLLFPVPPPPIKDRKKKRFWSHQAMIYHSFRGVFSNINQHKPLSPPPPPQGISRLGKLERVSDGSRGKIP